MKHVTLGNAIALIAGSTLVGCAAQDAANAPGEAADIDAVEGSLAVAISIAEYSALTFPEELALAPAMRQSLSDVLPDNTEAVVHWHSVLSFAPSVSRLQQEDILNATSFAQASARATTGFDFPSTLDEAEDQYTAYTGVLGELGWTAQHYGFQRYSSEESEFRLDSVALAVIGEIATSGQLNVLTRAVETLSALPADAGAVTLFERLATEGSRGNFEVGTAEIDANGFLSFCLGGFYFEASDERRRFLFFQWGSREIGVWITAQCMTLNDAIYSGARDIVVDRLAEIGATSAATRPLRPAAASG